jgi:CCR4-NOT transcription complex subunit 1
MTFPPPPPSAQPSNASGTDKSTSSRSSRSQQSAWGFSASQSGLRRGLTPLTTNNTPTASSTAAATSRRPPQSSSPGPVISASSPLTSTFSAILTTSSRLPGGRSAPSPASTPSSLTSLQPGSLQYQQPGSSLSSPKAKAITPSSGPHLASAAGSVVGGGGSGGGGGGTGSSRGVTFSPLLSGTTINSPTGFASDKPGSATSGSGVNTSQSSLTKISVAQVFLLLDSITEKEGKEKWETKAAQIHKVKLFDVFKTMLLDAVYLTSCHSSLTQTGWKSFLSISAVCSPAIHHRYFLGLTR